MRFNILQLLKNLRFHSHGKEIFDADILEWANSKVRNSGGQTRMASFKVLISEAFSYHKCWVQSAAGLCNLNYIMKFIKYFHLQDKSLSDGKYFLELLSAVLPRSVDWSLVTKGESGMFPFGSKKCCLIKQEAWKNWSFFFYFSVFPTFMLNTVLVCVQQKGLIYFLKFV